MSKIDLDRLHQYVSNRFANTPVAWEPFPHIYISEVFPTDLYQQMRARLPPKEALHSAADLFNGHAV